MPKYTIQAAPEARERLEAYFNEIVDRRRAGDLSDVSQYASRWCEQAARVSITLHVGLHGTSAHLQPLQIETADKAIRLAKWFADQQLSLLTKGRRAGAKKAEEEVVQLLKERAQGRHLEPNERELGHPIDYLTARTIQRARIVPDAAKAAALLSRMESDGLLVGEDVVPDGGGKATRIFRCNTNPLPE